MSKIREAKESGEWFKQPVLRKALVIPAFMQDALAKNKRAFAYFNELADSYKRQYVAWISNAKREETRNKRLEEAISSVRAEPEARTQITGTLEISGFLSLLCQFLW